jgi:hypothetical protein
LVCTFHKEICVPKAIKKATIIRNILWLFFGYRFLHHRIWAVFFFGKRNLESYDGFLNVVVVRYLHLGYIWDTLALSSTQWLFPQGGGAKRKSEVACTLKLRLQTRDMVIKQLHCRLRLSPLRLPPKSILVL